MERHNRVVVKKICRSCGNTIQGRADKKYCDDQCRNDFNNKLNSDQSNFMRRINNILRKNRRILHELHKNGNLQISREQLFYEGYNFKYFTSYNKTSKGEKQLFCYDMGVTFLEEDLLEITTKEIVYN